MVRAKFWVSNIEVFEHSTKVSLNPVYSGSPENDTFFEATPSGHLEMYIKNDIAAQQFNLHQEFYVDFIPASADMVVGSSD